jgi:hypothetical protein
MNTFPDHLNDYIAEFLTPADRFRLNATCKNEYTTLETEFPDLEEALSSPSMIEYVRSYKYFKFDERFFILSIKTGDLELIKLMKRLLCVPVFCDCYTVAIENKWTKIVKWLYKKGYPFHGSTLETAIEHRDYYLIDWLITRDCPITPECLNLAVESNNYNLVSKILFEGCVWPMDLFNRSVVRCTNMKIVKSLYELSFNDLSKPFFTQDTIQEARRHDNHTVARFMSNKLAMLN